MPCVTLPSGSCVELGAEAGAQGGVGDEDVGDLQAGEVEGLRRRGTGDRAGGDLLAERGEGRGAAAGQGEVGVDLVGHDDGAVAAGHLGELGELVG